MRNHPTSDKCMIQPNVERCIPKFHVSVETRFKIELNCVIYTKKYGVELQERVEEEDRDLR